MALARKKIHTTEDIYQLPEGDRAELIDGDLYMMSPPNTTHQRISAALHAEIYNYIRTHGGKCETFAAPFAVFLNTEADDRNYVEPDISVICDPKKITEKGCNCAPDWIIEIVSPSSRRMDYYTKLFKYRTAGVKEYWIVDPEKLRIMVYSFTANSGNEYTFSDTVTPSIYDDLEIDFSAI